MNFEGRRKGEMTSMYLGRVLEEYLHYPEMAKRAREGHFDDYFCPPEVDDGMNMLRLVNELGERSDGLLPGAPQWQKVQEVIKLVKQGEFDGTKEESDRWMASKDGQETVRMLVEREEERQ